MNSNGSGQSETMKHVKQPDMHRSYHRIVHFIFLLFVSALFSLYLYATANKIMTYFSHNEHMYIAAGYLIKQGKVLYRDFAFLQMPLLPLLYGTFYKLTGTSLYLLIGKCFSCLFYFASALILVLYSRRISRSGYFSFSIVILFLLNFTFLGAAQESSNYIAPIFTSFLAYHLFVGSIESTPGFIRLFLSGVFTAITVGLKLYYAPIVFPFLFTALLFPRSKRFKERIISIFLPLVLGTASGFLPVLYYMASNYSVFIFDNLGYHVTNTLWRTLSGYTGVMTLSAKMMAAREVFFSCDNLLIISGAILVLSFGMIKRRPESGPGLLELVPPGLFLSVLLAVVSLVTLFQPTPMFIRYFPMPMSFLLLVFISAFPLVHTPNDSFHKIVSLSFALILITYSTPALFPAKGAWKGFTIHTIARNIKQELPKNPSGAIATLSPLFAVEADLPIYPELATGPFLYRIGDLLTPEQRKLFHGTSPSTISKLFDSRPPLAIFTGFEGDLDTPLIRYAVTHNYRKVHGFFGGGMLYVRR